MSLFYVLAVWYTNPLVVREHSHAPDKAALEVERLRQDMRELVSNSRVNPVDVVAIALQTASDKAKMSFGRISTIKRDLRLARHKKKLLK